MKSYFSFPKLVSMPLNVSTKLAFGTRFVVSMSSLLNKGVVPKVFSGAPYPVPNIMRLCINVFFYKKLRIWASTESFLTCIRIISRYKSMIKRRGLV